MPDTFNILDRSPAPYYDGFLLTNGGEAVVERRFATTDMATAASGLLVLTYFMAKVSEPITQVRMRTGGTAAAAPTLCRIGIWTASDAGALTELVGSIANDTTLFAAANTTYTKSLSATWNKIAGQRYAAGYLVVTAVTTPTLVGGPSGLLAGMTAGLGVSPRRNGSVSGQTDLPSTVAAGSISDASRQPQFEFLP